MSMRYFLPILLCGGLAACGGGTEVVTTLDSAANVEEDMPVYFNDAVAGTVTKIERNEAGTTVHIELEDETAGQVDSSAIIVKNTLKAGAPLEIHNSNTPAGQVEDGAELRGITSMLQFGAWKLGDALDFSTDSANQYVEQFQEYMGSDQWQQQKQQMRDKIRESGDAAQQALRDMEKDLGDAARQLEEMEQGAIVGGEQLGQELGEILGEFQQNSEQIIRELEKLASRMQQPQGDGEAGQSILEMFLALLQGLNQGLEDPDEPGQQGDNPSQPDGDAAPEQDSTIL